MNRGRGRKTWRECVNDDIMNLLGLKSEFETNIRQKLKIYLLILNNILKFRTSRFHRKYSSGSSTTRGSEFNIELQPTEQSPRGIGILGESRWNDGRQIVPDRHLRQNIDGL